MTGPRERAREREIDETYESNKNKFVVNDAIYDFLFPSLPHGFGNVLCL
jgi:hypothetical protein